MSVDIAAERLQGGGSAYTVRLRERDGTPVTRAALTILGRSADGVLVGTSLDPTTEPGVYHTAVKIADLSDARLRVDSAGMIQELPLPE